MHWKKIYLKGLHLILFRLEFDVCTFSHRILKKNLHYSILELIFINCKLLLQDICDIMDVFNGTRAHHVDFSKS